MISFSSIVKDEISKIDTDELSSISELSAIFYNSIIISDKIKITTENASIARHIFNLIKRKYEINPRIIVRKNINYHNKNLYILELNQKVATILNDLSITDGEKRLEIPKDYITADDSLRRAYLKGLFITSGSINDPKKSRYHLEFLVNNLQYANYINNLLNQDYLNSKVLKRDNKYMVYIKEAEKIGDFLRIIGAYNAILYYEDIRIYRDHKNMTNRLNNCEQANIDKIIETATKEVNNIEKIKKVKAFELLSEKEQLVAEYRLKYKEASLAELSEIITKETSKPITKSGVYHRLKKVNDLAKKIAEKEKF